MDSIVTGGCGYIGGHLTDSLAGSGDEVTIIDDMSTGNYRNPKSRLLKADLQISQVLDLPRGARMFHLAANPSVQDSMSNAAEHFDRDVKATHNALELARKNDAKMFVFASTSAVYGETGVIPTPETEQALPISNYALFKVLSESMVGYYSRTYGLRAVTLRLANVIGGRANHGVICDFIRKLGTNSTELEILGDGRQRKSYVYIDDVVRAFMAFGEFRPASGYDCFNIGSTDWVDVEQIAAAVEKGMGLAPRHVYPDKTSGRGWPGDVRTMLLDVRKAKEAGWEPRYGSEAALDMAVSDALAMPK
ncbi:GDP-L-fucose synthase [uncultured archaeon]|nr:GDP-L-fucose synthase [uncultured archaeon]